MIALNEDKQSKGIRTEAIIASIEKDLEVKGLSQGLIEPTLQHLKEKGAVKKVRGKEGDLYFLAQDERTRIELMTEQYSKTVAQVKVDLTRKMKEKGLLLDISDEAIVFVTFRNFLALALSELGKECCFALLSSHGKDLDSFKHVNVIDVLNDVLKTVENETTRQIEREAFTEFISNPTEALSDFLFSLAQSYFFIQILHLDPQCQLLTTESLRRKKVYLDTNVIFHALTGTKPRHKAVDYALKLTASLGITTVLSERTKEEFVELLGSRKVAFGKDVKVQIERFEKVSDSVEDGFLKDFLRKKADNPNLAFDRYADRLEELETVLKNRYSTVFDNNEYKEIHEAPEMPSLKEIVIDEGEKSYLQKSSRVGEHDAFHILLIQKLREKDEGDVLGPNFWFLTHDRTLLGAEKRFGKHENCPSSIFISSWVQLISPMLSPKHTRDARDAYVGLFASRLPILSGAIDEEIFAAYQGKWMDDEDLTPKDISRIMGNRYIKDIYEKSKQTEEPIPEEEKEKMVRSVIAEIKSQNREMAWMKSDIRTLKTETERLRGEVGTWRQRFERQRTMLTRLGHVMGGIVFLGLSFGLYEFFIRIHSVEHWPALISSMILAAAAGAIADLFGYRWLLNRLLRYKQTEVKE